MPKHMITAEQQMSNVRVATLRVELVRAVGVVLNADPDLTYEEVLAALLLVASTQVAQLRRPDEDDEEETP